MTPRFLAYGTHNRNCGASIIEMGKASQKDGQTWQKDYESEFEYFNVPS